MNKLMCTHEPIRLIAVGDICPGDHLCMGFGTGSLMRRYGTDFALRHVRALLRESDLVFGNCEGVLSDIGADARDIDTMEFRGLPEFARELRNSGFGVMSVANNHVGEHGPDVLHDTVEHLGSAGIEVIGLRDERRTSAPLIHEVNGLRIGWLAYTWVTSNNGKQDRTLLAVTRGEEVADEVRALRQEVDFLIVAPHWGREFVQVPPQHIVDMAHEIADAGADLILGSHPHVVQGTQRRGRCLIVYSLGNFLFDIWQSRLRETALFRCTIESGNVRDFEFVPLKLNRRFQPVVATGAVASRIHRSIAESTRAIHDPALAELRNEERVRKIEAKFKRWLFWSGLLHLLLSIGRMGPRIAWQKLGRRLPGFR